MEASSARPPTPGRRPRGPRARRCRRSGRRRPGGRSRRGGRGSGASGRSRAARAGARAVGRSSSSSKCVTAARGVSVSSEWRSRSWRSRPIGASIVPRRDRGFPTTSARYSRVSARRRTSRCSPSYASCERATTSRPDVSRSRRWTIPGRSSSPPCGAGGGKRLRERAARVPGRRVHDDAGRLVHDEEVLVLVRDRELGQRDGAAPRRPARRLDRDLLPTRELVALRRAAPRRRARRPPRAAAPPRRASRPPAARRDSGRAARPRPRRDDEPLQRLGRPRLSLGEDERGEEDPDPDHDEAVGEVERRPVAEVEEVGDEAEPHAVGEVRDAAADHEAERDRQHRMAGARAREVGEHPARSRPR